LQHFAAELPEKHVFVVSDRRGWREQPAPTETFGMADGKLELTAPEKVWKRSLDPKSEDPSGILLLTGARKEKDKDNRKNATLLVFTLEKQADLNAALKAVREHLAAQKKLEN